MNFIHIAGHLGADPEVRFTSTGKKVTTLKVASHSRRGKGADKGTDKEKGGKGEEITIWWRVTIWGDQFDKMVSFLKKGSAVMVYGDLHKPEIFMDREGKPQVTLEITAVYLEFSPFGGKPGGQTAGSGEEGKVQQPQAPHAEMPVNPYMSFSPHKAETAQAKGETFDDEVPF